MSRKRNKQFSNAEKRKVANRDHPPEEAVDMSCKISFAPAVIRPLEMTSLQKEKKLYHKVDPDGHTLMLDLISEEDEDSAIQGKTTDYKYLMTGEESFERSANDRNNAFIRDRQENPLKNILH